MSCAAHNEPFHGDEINAVCRKRIRPQFHFFSVPPPWTLRGTRLGPPAVPHAPSLLSLSLWRTGPAEQRRDFHQSNHHFLSRFFQLHRTLVGVPEAFTDLWGDCGGNGGAGEEVIAGNGFIEVFSTLPEA